MFVKSYALGFEGYWREPAIGGLPAASGIYGVYACTFDARAGTVSLWRLLYLGEATNVRDRVQGHEKFLEWRSLYMGPGALPERGLDLWRRRPPPG